jgi:hypothetical protein
MLCIPFLPLMAHLWGIMILLLDVSQSARCDSRNTAEFRNRIVLEYFSYSSQRKAHPPLEAGAEVDHGVEVHVRISRRQHSGF